MKSLFLSLLCLLSSTSLLAANQTPKAVVEKIFSSAKNPNVATDKKAQEGINKLISFDQMAIDSLGKHRAELSKEQFEWFRSTLQSIITETVYPEAPDFFKNVKVDYEDEKVKKGSALIVSVISEKGEETQVDYKLKLLSGNWKVVDIAIDEESWIESISSEVNTVMKKEKWAGLKSKLSKRLEDIRSKDKKAAQKKTTTSKNS